MATATFKSISKELELIDVKKSKLKSAFEDLQAFYSVPNLKWEDLDSYFTSLQSNLLDKFTRIQSQNPDPISQFRPPPQQPKRKETTIMALSNPVPARPELKSFCENMDGLGLRNYILDRPKGRAAIRVELADAWKYAPDPAKLVLNALQGLIGDDSGSTVTGEDLAGLRVGVVLLEELMKATVEIKEEVKEEAKAIAAEWKGKLAAASSGRGGVDGDGEEDGLGKLCFLHLLAAFRLVENGGFDVNELIDYAVAVARYRQAVELYRALNFGDKISDIIQKLIGKGRHLSAVKFIFQFEMTDKFPPVPLLKTYVLDSKKLAQEVHKDGKSSRQSLNEATAKEISSLKSVIRMIDDHNLESQYSKDIILKRLEKLEKVKASKKRPSAVPSVKAQERSKQQKLNVGKQIRKNVAANPTVPIQQPHMQMAGLLANSYLSTPAAAYGLAGSTSAVAHYGGTSAGVYGLPGTHIDPSIASLYPSETSSRPSYYDRSVVYGGPGYGYAPQYHQAYYPQ